MIKAILKKKISPRVVINGHPWIFANEVNLVEGEVEPGDIVEVYTHDKKFVGKGYINPASQILVRLLTRDKNETINEDFFLPSIAQSLAIPPADRVYRELPSHLR